jgi:polysaccharide pyruvyl transferase WcaK-like protein
MKVLIIGYYNRYNWGDDLFEYIFRNSLFTSDDITVVNIDDVEHVKGTFDKIIIGGGDVVNDYFLNQENIKLIVNISNGCIPNTPIYFVGTGIPYVNNIQSMDIGDQFFMRNSTDYEMTKERYGADNTYLIPDLGFGLNLNPSVSHYANISAQVRKIGMCIPFNYAIHSSFTDDLISLINSLASTYEVYLIPFDTNKTVKSDITYIQRLGNNDNVTIVDKTLSVEEMIDYFKNMDLIVASRFHSIILSILLEKPFVSLYTTRKIDNIRRESRELSSMFVPLNKDINDAPVNIDVNNVTRIIADLSADYMNVVKTVRVVKNRNVKSFDLSALGTKLRILPNRQSPPQNITDDDTMTLIKKTLINVLSKISNKISLRDIDSLFKGVSMINIVPRQKNLVGYKQILTQEILFSITGDPYGPYYYGLLENVLTNNCVGQLKWIINDYYQNYYYQQNSSNFTIINKNFQRLHRSGWQYIVNNLVLQLNNNSNHKTPLIIDTYIDKTFHWNKDFYKSKGIIPYTQAWIGFIHHTYSDYNNPYNCAELFQDKDFIESLATCKCLIVMTDYLKDQIVSSLNELNISVDVYSLTHPTEYSDVLFDMDLFNANQNKQIIQIGNWLRDVFAIYRLEIPKNGIVDSKAILKNKNSDAYFPPDGFLDTLNDQMNSDQDTTNQTICRNSFSNMHIKGLFDCVSQMEHSVTEINYLDNKEYDTLLSQNIVFLKLVDASACNTVIECIVRNVPIVVNRIPPVVEVLGKNYPLYYDTLYEASKLLEDPQNIQDAFDYLTKIEKFAFNIDEFMNSLTAIISKYIN